MEWPERATAADVPPREVPGYAEAAAAGLTPRVPAEAPALGPCPSARTPWDHSALWHLDGSTGRVLRPPHGGGDPPGMYPSPTRPGTLELWTGVLWQRHFRDHLPGNPGHEAGVPVT